MLAIAASADEAVTEPPTGGFVAVDAVGVAVEVALAHQRLAALRRWGHCCSQGLAALTSRDCAAGAVPERQYWSTFIGLLGPVVFVSSTFVGKNHFLDVFGIRPRSFLFHISGLSA